MDSSPPDSSVHGIFQAIILKWVAISFFRVSSPLRNWTSISCIGRWVLYFVFLFFFFLFFINKLSFYWDRIHIKLIILFTFKNWPFKNILVTDILYIKDIVQLSFLYHSKYFQHPKRKPHSLQVTTSHSSLPTPVNHKLAFSLYAFT